MPTLQEVSDSLNKATDRIKELEDLASKAKTVLAVLALFGLGIGSFVGWTNRNLQSLQLEVEQSESRFAEYTESAIAKLHEEEARLLESAKTKGTSLWGLSTQAMIHEFRSVGTAIEIPGSRNAAFCALAAVDDDAGPAWCSVSKEGNIWKHQTHSGTQQRCAAICLFISQGRT